jgi:hypothetical protein
MKIIGGMGQNTPFFCFGPPTFTYFHIIKGTLDPLLLKSIFIPVSVHVWAVGQAKSFRIV